jgi:drug/metabolite transporter (DMT)-like permease
MALVTAAAFFMAVLFLLFKVFENRRIALLPAIVVNYFAAFLCGVLVAPPWSVGDITPLALPSALLGFLFITIFYLTGISAQRAGVAATTVASKMSLVLTVLFAVFVYGDRPGPSGWTGIILALIGVVLASWVRNRGAVRGEWILPTILFFGNAIIDIAINWIQRNRLTASTEAVLPTMVFACAGILGALWMLRSREHQAFARPEVWLGGSLLGIMNYAALYFVVQALAHTGMPSSSVYPLINIMVILLGTAASMLIFRERPRGIQYIGIACAMLALALILDMTP